MIEIQQTVMENGRKRRKAVMSGSQGPNQNLKMRGIAYSLWLKACGL
jgi:hypothetical protein